MTRNKFKRKRKVLIKIALKKAWRSRRSRLNVRLSRGQKLSRKTAKKYHLNNNPFIREYKTKKLETIRIKVPQYLCFLKDPKGTSNFLAYLKNIMQQKKPRNYFVDHTETEIISLASSFIFDETIRKEIDHWRRRNIKINISGEISGTKKVNNFLLAFGFLRLIGITAKNFRGDRVDWDYRNKYETFEFKGNKTDPLYASFGSEGLVDYFNKCLKYNNFELTEYKRNEFIETIGEIIGNAEYHCGNDIGDWTVLGAYDKDDHICHFAIINYGNSIYQSLSSKESTASVVLEEIQGIILKHKPIWEKAGRIFKNEDEETIWNVMSLQDGISSKRTVSGSGSTRGLGMMEVLSFVNEVKPGQGDAIICLLSGKSVISIDYEYPIIEQAKGSNKEKRRMIIFNKKQALHEPSDERKVRTLVNGFDGTIFTGTFKIDEKYLRQVADGKNN